MRPSTPAKTRLRENQRRLKQRVARLIDPRTRKRYRLARWLEGEGIEIGALFRPLTVPV